ncbi:Eukaryotic translation initiation factor 5B [Galdieria sulphuraria]|nr:Eukaryotic translation initiation factor 5B [Galdieria sulphuraria]
MEDDEWNQEKNYVNTAIFGKKKKKKKEKVLVEQEPETNNVKEPIDTEVGDTLENGARQSKKKPVKEKNTRSGTKSSWLENIEKRTTSKSSTSEDGLETPSKLKSEFVQWQVLKREEVERENEEEEEEEEEEKDLLPGRQQPNKSLLLKFASLSTEEDETTEDVEENATDTAEKPTDSSIKPQTDVKKQSSLPSRKSQKGKRVKKSKRTAKEEEEIDALIAQLEEPSTPAKHEKKEERDSVLSLQSTMVNETEDPVEADKNNEKKNADGVEDASFSVNGVIEDQQRLTANQKKKLKKKAAKERAEESKETSNDVESKAVSQERTNEGAGGNTKKKKKESAALRKMKEVLYAKKLEEERLRREQEEAEKRAEEERLREEEEERRKEELRRQKKEAEKEKRRKMKQEGKLLSRNERQKRERAAQFREQAIASGAIPAFHQGDSTVQKKVYSRKQKHSKQTDMQNPEDIKEYRDEESVSHTYTASANTKSLAISESEQVKSSTETVMNEVRSSWDAEDWDNEAEKLRKGSLDLDELVVSGNFSTHTEERMKKDHGARSREERQMDVVVKGEEASEEMESSSSYSSEEQVQQMERSLDKRRELTHRLRQEKYERAYKYRNPDNLRAPVICILGHVDTGKTKILDKIRKTSVQEGEAGGITQQIGATYFPIDRVKEQVEKVGIEDVKYKIPSLLIIDTPGHESFTNLRSRGSSLCDIAILVVDIMHGIEPQTMESIELLKLRKTPFVVALNKVDRLFGWKEEEMSPIRQSLKKQAHHVQEEFKQRVLSTQVAFAELGFNADLYWQVSDARKYVSLVPTSAVTGEGIPDLLLLLVQFSQRMLVDRIMFMPFLTCTVLEVKVIEGLGTTIDVILTNGELHEGDTIVVCGLEGPIVTTIRALLTPHPMKEMRVKADSLDKAVAGTQLLVMEEGEDLEVLKEDVMSDLSSTLSSVDKSGVGVYVQASTLGSLEALLEFLRTSKIPVSGINIGPVHKKDVMRASAMLEHRKEYATILAFDVKVEKEAKELAEEYGVRIFTADIIYHLFDQFTTYMEQIRKSRKEEASSDVVFPCVLHIVPNCIFNKKDPIIVGVQVVEGIARVGTPLVVRNGIQFLDIGRIQSIEQNKKPVSVARKGDSVAVKISSRQTETIMFGRHFDEKNDLYSKLSRRAIDLLKENFRDELSVEDWQLVVKLKKMLNIL